MANRFINLFFTRLKRIFRFGIPAGSKLEDVREVRRERVAVFAIAYIMAISLWFIVNLNGDYNTTINIPLEPGTIPKDMALVEGLPEFVQVEVSGDGWKLVALYNNPPKVPIDIAEGEVNLFDQVRQRFSIEQDVSVIKVQPFIVNIGLEPKISKKIPITLASEISFVPRYGLVSEKRISPDSLVITGATSQIAAINAWIIPDTLVLENIQEDINLLVPINSTNRLIIPSVSETNFTAQVSEFTEGEVTVYIKTQDLPRGQVINYNPSSVSIRFDIPIEQYNQIENIRPYEVYVPYSKILEDSTGLVTPDIELTATQYPIKLRSFQPKAVAYFSILDQ